jgi:ferritin
VVTTGGKRFLLVFLRRNFNRSCGIHFIANLKTKKMTEITFNTLPEAVQTVLTMLEQVNKKIDNLPAAHAQEQDDNR